MTDDEISHFDGLHIFISYYAIIFTQAMEQKIFNVDLLTLFLPINKNMLNLHLK